MPRAISLSMTGYPIETCKCCPCMWQYGQRILRPLGPSTMPVIFPLFRASRRGQPHAPGPCHSLSGYLRISGRYVL